MVEAHGDNPAFNYQIVDSREQDAGPTMSVTRLTRFGVNSSRNRQQGKRNQAMHIVWCPGDMMRNPADVLDDNSVGSLLRFGIDVRDWCKENDVPIPTTLAGIASGLLRDKRFWPNARGRVPHATNERVRPYLPGVYAELRGKVTETYQAVALDQRRAYHRAAQTVPMPDSTSLFARGYFANTEDSPVWAKPGTQLYERTIAQPGLVAIRATSRLTHKDETRPPAINYVGTRIIYLWTNEVPMCVEHGLQIHGIVAAWTSTKPDTGFPLYGAWAESQIDTANEFRARWLKPTLHAAYGLLATRPRILKIGHRNGNGRATTYILGIAHPFPVSEHTLGAHAPKTNNVAALGTLQAEIRKRSMQTANALMAEGVNVLHIHADGIHVAGKLPLLSDKEWSIKPRSNLTYLDRVSWLSDEGDCLPGRELAQRIETRKHYAHILQERCRRATEAGR